eukprot:366385-Chlamydomonas_euryale.AAC.5
MLEPEHAPAAGRHSSTCGSCPQTAAPPRGCCQGPSPRATCTKAPGSSVAEIRFMGLSCSAEP